MGKKHPVVMTQATSFIDLSFYEHSFFRIYNAIVDTSSEKEYRAFATLCGSTIPSPVRSTGSDMTLMFRSDATKTYSGFKAMITFTGGISKFIILHMG